MVANRPLAVVLIVVTISAGTSVAYGQATSSGSSPGQLQIPGVRAPRGNAPIAQQAQAPSAALQLQESGAQSVIKLSPRSKPPTQADSPLAQGKDSDSASSVSIAQKLQG
jgi:hypothetical protein